MLVFLFAIISIGQACQSTKMVAMKNAMSAKILNGPDLARNAGDDDIEGSGEDNRIDTLRARQTRPQNRECAAQVTVQIQTTLPFDLGRLVEYNAYINEELEKLQKYSGTYVSSFQGQLRKYVARINTPAGEVYGQHIILDNFHGDCVAVREFIRKAVSWGLKIPRAVVGCKCGPLMDIFKL